MHPFFAFLFSHFLHIFLPRYFPVEIFPFPMRLLLCSAFQSCLLTFPSLLFLFIHLLYTSVLHFRSRILAFSWFFLPVTHLPYTSVPWNTPARHFWALFLAFSTFLFLVTHLIFTSVPFYPPFLNFYSVLLTSSTLLLPVTHLLFASGTCSLSMLLTFSTFLYVDTDLLYTSVYCYSPSQLLLFFSTLLFPTVLLTFSAFLVPVTAGFPPLALVWFTQTDQIWALLPLLPFSAYKKAPFAFQTLKCHFSC
jgi:hypothetical protein